MSDQTTPTAYHKASHHSWTSLFLLPLCAAIFALQLFLGSQIANVQLDAKPKNNAINNQAHKETVHRLPLLAPDCRHIPCIALTFDDGPRAESTSRVLDALDQTGTPATFFVIGIHVPGNESLLRRMQARGDEIGNHSWSHSDFTTLTAEQIKYEISATQQVITVAGITTPRLFRPPYGAFNDTVRQNTNLRIALWNEDPRDWDVKTAAEVQANILGAARPGVVIDAHDIYDITADALVPTINELKARGYTFVTMSQMMDADDPGPGHEFYGLKP